MIKLKNLVKIYNKKSTAVDNLSLVIPKGKVFGFLGPNGAGKTTTIKIIVGINKPSSGSVTIDGESPLSVLVRERIGFMPEDPRLYDELTGLEILDFAARLFEKSFNKTRDELEKILKKVEIYESRNKKIKTYSKGMRQRLGFAQAIVNNPDYLFLDEPLEGLDPIGRRDMKTILEKLKGEGKTIFFNSHILADVESICDEIGIIHKGKLVYSGSVSNFRGLMSLEDKFVETIKFLDKK